MLLVPSYKNQHKKKKKNKKKKLDCLWQSPWKKHLSLHLYTPMVFFTLPISSTCGGGSPQYINVSIKEYGATLL